MIEAIETVVAFAATQSGLAAMGLAVACLILVRRGAQGRRRTD